MEHRERVMLRRGRMRTLGASVLVVCLMLVVSSASAQERDICGCRDSVTSLGDFVASDTATWATLGATSPSAGTIAIPLPEDGVLILDSFTVDSQPGSSSGVTVLFERNLRNTPVRLLVKGDVTVASASAITLGGYAGQAGNYSEAGGLPGLGGPGGHRGGHGAFQYVDGHARGGQGLGVGGGAGASGNYTSPGAPGTFVGAVPALLPLNGGSGGGGGGSITTAINAKGGGGGGGGGAILVAANGTVTVNGTIRANGAAGGRYGYSSNSGSGGAGSGGAIRILADTLAGVGVLQALTGGAIRIESFNLSFPPGNSSPIASYVNSPGPVYAPIVSSVGIASVNGVVQSEANGELLFEAPAGVVGDVDVTLDAPGIVAVEILTEGVPSGTLLDVNAKPKHGDGLVTESATIDAGSCDAAGDCVTLVFVTLDAGTYYLEAEATFQTP